MRGEYADQTATSGEDKRKKAIQEVLFVPKPQEKLIEVWGKKHVLLIDCAIDSEQRLGEIMQLGGIDQHIFETLANCGWSLTITEDHDKFHIKASMPNNGGDSIKCVC